MLPLLLIAIASCSRATSEFSADEIDALGEDQVRIGACGHAHNDYENPRPLIDALEHGFCSIEADVHLVDGDLLVAHTRGSADPSRSLETLYLEPLERWIASHGGRVFGGDQPPLLLLIDIKSDAEDTYRVLHEQLARHARLLTTFEGNQVREGAVTVIVSGNRPRDMMASQRVRFAALDGRVEDLDSNDPPTLIPLISDSWYYHFSLLGFGKIPNDKRDKLVELVHRAHARGRRIRFWQTSDSPETWRALANAGVDLINTDDVKGLARFLGRASVGFARQPALQSPP